jgi:hypothetical protein
LNSTYVLIIPFIACRLELSTFLPNQRTRSGLARIPLFSDIFTFFSSLGCSLLFHFSSAHRSFSFEANKKKTSQKTTQYSSKSKPNHRKMSSLDKLTDMERAHCVASTLEELEARKVLAFDTPSKKLIAFELAVNKEADRMVAAEEKAANRAAEEKAANRVIDLVAAAATKGTVVHVGGSYVDADASYVSTGGGDVKADSSTKTTSTKTHHSPAISPCQLFSTLAPDLLGPKVHWSPELKEVKEKNVKRGQSYVPTWEERLATSSSLVVAKEIGFRFGEENRDLRERNARLYKTNGKMEVTEDRLRLQRDDLGKQLHDLRKKLQAQDAQLQSKDAQSQAQVVQLQAKDAQIQAKDAQLEAKDAQLDSHIREWMVTLKSTRPSAAYGREERSGSYRREDRREERSDDNRSYRREDRREDRREERSGDKRSGNKRSGSSYGGEEGKRFRR